MQMALTGSKPYGEVDYFNLSEAGESAQTGNVIVKPSSSSSEVVNVTFREKIPGASHAVCWLTKFALEGSANQESNKAANLDCSISGLTAEGFQLKVFRPPNGQSEVGVGWLVYDDNAWLSRQQVAYAPFLPSSWDLDATASNALWARKNAVKNGLQVTSALLPQIVGFISRVQSYDAVQASVQYATGNGALLHTESRGRVYAQVITSLPRNDYLDMVFMP